jgi:D-3-phosphoglycerate dehydrogenase
MAKGLMLRLVGFDPYAPDSAFEALGVQRCTSFDDLLDQANILSLHCPLTDQTRSILNADALARMPAGSYVINTARGGLIDEAALVAAIQSGHIAGAGLDTFAVEPPAANHPFFNVPEIVMTPHIGGVTRQAGARVGIDAVRGIFQVLNGLPVAPERIINRKLLAAAQAERSSVGKSL